MNKIYNEPSLSSQGILHSKIRHKCVTFSSVKYCVPVFIACYIANFANNYMCAGTIAIYKLYLILFIASWFV